MNASVGPSPIDPNYPAAYAGLAGALQSEWTLGNASLADFLPPALAATHRAIELDPNSGEAYTVLGGRQARIRTLKAQPAPTAKYILAAAYTRLGGRDRAFLYLNHAVDQHTLWMSWLEVDPVLDDLRADTRFNDLRRRINLPPHDER